jgi:hypothetical protein
MSASGTKRTIRLHPRLSAIGAERTSRGLEKEERSMNAAESKGLKKGNRAYWRGDATDSGIITEMMQS